MQRRPPADRPDNEHVGVVPLAGLRVRLASRLTEAHALEIEPRVGEVARRAPQMTADAAGPLPGFTVTVVADAVDHVAIDGSERVAHHEIRGLQRRKIEAGMNALVGAVVVLEIVDAPARPRLGVLALVLVAARATAA